MTDYVEICVPWDSLISSLTDSCRDRGKLKKLIQEVDLSVAEVDFTLEIIRMLSESLMVDMAQADKEKVQKKIDKFIAYLEGNLDACF